jgi:hypothetical protein
MIFLFWKLAKNKNVIKGFICLGTTNKQLSLCSNNLTYIQVVPGFTLCQGVISKQVTAASSPAIFSLPYIIISFPLNNSGFVKYYKKQSITKDTL